MKFCTVCENKVPHIRKHSEFCSKKCEAKAHGYRERWEQILKQKLEGSTAWRPLPLEPITEIHSSKPIAIFSDVHAPIHSVKWLELGIKASKKFGAETLIVNGDFIDANTISRHLGGYYRRKNELEDDLAAGEALMNIFADNFKKVYFLSGNHCLQRLMKMFNGEVAAKRLWNLFTIRDNVKLTPRSFVYVNNDVIVGHPRNYSGIRGNFTQKLAQLKQKHVATGHHHHSARTATSDGKWQACEIPCMADLEEMEYVRNEINTFPDPMNGFGMIFGTRIEVFDKFTNWKLYGL